MFEKRKENILKAVRRQNPESVPILANTGPAIVAYGGKKLTDVIYDFEEYAVVGTKIFDDMYADCTVLAAPTTTPKIEEILGVTNFRIGPDGITLQHDEHVYMKDDEYPELINDPIAFVSDVLLPRKYPFLFKDDIESVKQKIKDALSEQSLVFGPLSSAWQDKVENQYGIPMIDDYFNTYLGYPPIDMIFDYFRGFKNTIIDLRRNKGMVYEACDAIWETYMAPAYDNTTINIEFPFNAQAPHIPAYLNRKQFEELYWPILKKIGEKLSAGGNRASVILEGKWLPVIDYFRDAPKDSFILMVDDDDTIEISKEIGDWQTIAGGAVISNLMFWDKQKCIDYTKKVIDECAPGGGFIFTTDKNWISPADINQNLIDVYNFAHKYGKY